MPPPAPSSASATLTGVLERIIFLNEENHYTIAEFRPDLPPAARADAKARAELVTIVGALPSVECGETLHLTGEWTRHAQHGAQFKIAAFKSELPASVYGIRKYLGSGLVPGIGKVYANKIVDAFGTDTFRVLSEESGRLRDVEGIGKKRATAIKQAWDAKRTERELYIFLQTYGVTPSQCLKLVKHFGPGAKTILTTEPYRAAREIDGIGFKTADRIAINLGFANDAPPRLDAGLIYALETLQEDGHTAYREADLVTHAAGLLETDSRFLEARIAALVENKSIVRHWPILGDAAPSPRSGRAEGGAAPNQPLPGSGLVQLPHNDRAEQKIAGTVARLARVPSGLPPIKIDAAVEWAEKKAGFEFAELQRTALRAALAHKLSILTGGPGTGKAQPLDARVLTPTGFRAIGELRPGDLVIAAEGQAVAVRSIHPQGKKPTYRVIFADGRATRCCDDHLWRVWTRTSVWSPEKRKKIRSRGWRVLPLSTIRRRIDLDRTECARLGIPLLTASFGEAPVPLPIDPYILGALIGDGTLSDAVLITTTDSALVASLSARLQSLDLRLKQVISAGVPTISWRIVGRGKGFPNPLREALKTLGLSVKSHAKFIPPAYLFASATQRLDLLRGLLDTDGTVDKLGVVSFTTSSPRLAEDFQHLAWSLGCIATRGVVKHPTYTHRGKKLTGLPAHTIFLQHPAPGSLFSLERKIRRTCRPKARARLGHRLRLTAVEPAGEAECCCISIDSPTGLYVTDDYIVTHNTTILRALVEILKAKQVRVHLAAPTGRAAQRLSATTGGFATTIHRLLGYDAAAGGFLATDDKPLATDFLIVDEASMLDNRLAAALLQAVPSRAHVLLVGDTDQLPSVGAGNVLKDLIAASGSVGDAAPSPRSGRGEGAAAPAIPVTRLSVIFRQQGQSQIVTTAHAINAGEPKAPPVAAEVSAAQVWADLNFIAASDAEDCVRKVLQLVTEFIPQKLKWPHPIHDVQVLAPMHKGVAGVANLNTQLQAALNAHGRGLRAGGAEFRVGDKVIQLRNNYDKAIFNGDIGTVVSADPAAGALEVDFDGTRQPLERGELGDLAPAYAISIHKSQGSEYPVVIVPLLKAHFMMLQRNLLYTAITRGKKKVFLVGDPAAYAMAVRNAESKTRCTHLREKIAALAQRSAG
ncbi:MAG: AAA family ATPase [Opitutaceae bacterium]|nr:AAA family ATPase [Opitutaceae bacterium]